MVLISRCIITLSVFLGLNVLTSFAATKAKPHTHQGALEPYDGKHIAYSLTKEENALLNSGKPVTINQRNGKSGRGIVIQDIHASPQVCLSKISDLPNYSKMVPNVKSIDIYDNEVDADGSTRIGAMFKVGVSFVTFGYYLRLKYNPSYMTYTWTLDYQYSSDFDDNTGHWQAMEHPTKKGWSRVLYSTEVKLFPWIPEFVITFLTKTALIESTTWVKRESEKHSSDVFDNPSPPSNGEPLNLKPCFLEDADGNNARYETNCIDEYVNRLKTVSIEVEAAGSVRELDTELLAASDMESQSTESLADTDSDTESQSTESLADTDMESQSTESVADSDSDTESQSTESVADSDSDTESQSTESLTDSDSDTESQSTEGTENEIFDESDSRAGSPDIEIVPLEEETHQEL